MLLLLHEMCASEGACDCQGTNGAETQIAHGIVEFRKGPFLRRKTFDPTVERLDLCIEGDMLLLIQPEQSINSLRKRQTPRLVPSL